METIHFDDKCTIECTRNGQKVEADILSFRENQFLSVVFQKTVKLQLQYNADPRCNHLPVISSKVNT